MTSPRPCPFCGAPSVDEVTGTIFEGFAFAGLGCSSDTCRVSPQLSTGSRDEALELWNRRPLHDELVAMLRELVDPPRGMGMGGMDHVYRLERARELLARAKDGG
jgi:hypothetical protein